MDRPKAAEAPAGVGCGCCCCCCHRRRRRRRPPPFPIDKLFCVPLDLFLRALSLSFHSGRTCYRGVIVCAGSARCCSGGRNGKASCEKKAAAAAPNNHRSRPCGFSFSLSLFPSSEADLSMRCLASGSAQESAERARKRELRGRESLALPRAIYQRRSRPRSPPPLLAAAAAALFSMRPSSRALSVACVLCKLSAS